MTTARLELPYPSIPLLDIGEHVDLVSGSVPDSESKGYKILNGKV